MRGPIACATIFLLAGCVSIGLAAAAPSAAPSDVSAAASSAVTSAPTSPAPPAPAVPVVGPVHFAPLPLEKLATGLALTEDGRQLVIASEAENALTFWDVTGGKVTKAVSCPSPRFVLC